MEKRKRRAEKEQVLQTGKEIMDSRAGAGHGEGSNDGTTARRKGRFNPEEASKKDDLLKYQMQTLVPEKDRKETALGTIRQAVREKTVRCTPSPMELIVIELQYISPGFWLLQGILTAALVFLLEKTALSGGGLRDYLQWTSVLAAWLGVVGCVSLGRHFSRGMAELEQSCFFNLSQHWAIKMALSGTVDILILLLASGRISAEASVPYIQVCLYVMMPFVLANICCLLFFTAIRGGRSRYGQLAMAFIAGIIAVVPASQPEEVYGGAFLWVWVLALFCGMGIYLWQLRCMYMKIRRGEIVCWN